MIVEGINVIRELLKSDEQIDKIIAEDKPNNEIQILIDTARAKRIKVELVDKNTLSRIAKRDTQGIIAFIAGFRYSEVEDILNFAKTKDEAPFIVILDGIMDPHNLGAIIRTCECAGVHGVIIPKNRACEITDTVYKTSAGALFHMRVAMVTNLTRTIEELKEHGVWTYALEAGEKSIYNADFTYPTALIVGGEGKGVSRLVKESADEVLSLDMFGRVNSLNASNAGAIAIYEVVRQRRGK